jgi:hypothetical protein
MMIIVERLVQQVRPGKWAELEAIDKKFDAVESRFGFPPKKRYQCVIGGLDQNTLIIEREWECLAQMEATYEKAFAIPEYQALGKELLSVVQSSQMEVYTLLP